MFSLEGCSLCEEEGVAFFCTLLCFAFALLCICFANVRFPQGVAHVKINNTLEPHRKLVCPLHSPRV